MFKKTVLEGALQYYSSNYADESFLRSEAMERFINQWVVFLTLGWLSSSSITGRVQ